MDHDDRTDLGRAQSALSSVIFGRAEHYFERLKDLKELQRLINQGKVTLSDLNLAQEKFNSFQHTIDLSWAKYCLAGVHQCKTSEYLFRLCRIVSEGKVTLAELDLTQEEYDSFPHMVDLHESKMALKSVRSIPTEEDLIALGKYVCEHTTLILFSHSFKPLDQLQKFVSEGKVTLAELDLTQEEYDRFPHALHLSEAKRALVYVRFSRGIGYYDRLYGLDHLRCMLGEGKVTLAELDLTQEEYDSFPQKILFDWVKFEVDLLRQKEDNTGTHLGHLRQMVMTGQVTLTELGLTQTEYEALTLIVKP